MNTSFLLGVPGKLKTLLDRLTSDRAGYLDTAISSRASSTQATNIQGSGFSSASDSLKILSDKIDILDAKNVEKQSQEFTSSGTWTRPTNVETVDILLVGGGGTGGSGNNDYGGGGGGGQGGEIVMLHNVRVTGNLTITLGAGSKSTITGGITCSKIRANDGANGYSSGNDGTGGTGAGLNTCCSLPGADGGTQTGNGKSSIFADGGAHGTTSGGGGGGGSFGVGGAGGTSGTNGSAGTKGGGGGGGGQQHTGGPATSGGAGGVGYCVIFWEEDN